MASTSLNLPPPSSSPGRCGTRHLGSLALGLGCRPSTPPGILQSRACRPGGLIALPPEVSEAVANSHPRLPLSGPRLPQTVLTRQRFLGCLRSPFMVARVGRRFPSFSPHSGPVVAVRTSSVGAFPSAGNPQSEGGNVRAR